MGMKITNLTEVVTMFKLVDKNVNQKTRDVMHAGAERIKQMAIVNAPIDEGNLEKAIKVKPSQGNQYSLKIVIAVEGIVGGRNVEEYAAIVHEYTWDKRGPLTRAKGPKAGPRYLFRAVRDGKQQLMRELAEATNKGIQSGIASSGVNAKSRRRR